MLELDEEGWGIFMKDSREERVGFKIRFTARKKTSKTKGNENTFR